MYVCEQINRTRLFYNSDALFHSPLAFAILDKFTSTSSVIWQRTTNACRCNCNFTTTAVVVEFSLVVFLLFVFSPVSSNIFYYYFQTVHSTCGVRCVSTSVTSSFPTSRFSVVPQALTPFYIRRGMS